MTEISDRDYSRLRDMLENARLALNFMRNKSRDDLFHDLLLAYAVVRALEVIGEAANYVSDDTQKLLPQIEWGNIIGMRNRMVHGYDNINFDIVWAVIESKLQPLILALLPLLRSKYPDLG
jgi:uncharacterized protein with HEPN domain